MGKTGLEIAIIGISCRLPRIENWKEFWNSLTHETELLEFIKEEELSKKGINLKKEKAKGFVNISSKVKNKDHFDAGFFNYTEKEAALMNPVHRIFHECAWQALEDSGYTIKAVDGEISLYAGSSSDLNWKLHALAQNTNKKVDNITLDLISSRNHLASLVSYNLNLKGPAFTIDTACSTSLSAVHLACRGLLFGEAKLAIAGGVSLSTNTQIGYYYNEGSIVSKDGYCRSFDNNATGTVFSEGAGMVVLKRLDEAIKDKDHIYAVIKGSAANNDGNRKTGYTAPSVEGQMECIRAALKIARVAPNTINYIEAHGTGTKLGDPIEIEALNLAFEKDTTFKCAIGSVKSNLGHTDTASGVVGLIKAALSLKHRQIPASLHMDTPNSEINFNEGPFYINTKLKSWEKNKETPRRAGISSFGIGGTNVHIILEESTDREVIGLDSEQKKLVLLSAKTKNSLHRNIRNLREFLEKNEHINMDDLSYTMAIGRDHFGFRKYFFFTSREELLKKLSSEDQVAEPENEATQEVDKLIEELARVWVKGADVDWNTYYKTKKGVKIPLPTYAFENKRYPTEVDVSNINIKEIINSNSMGVYIENESKPSIFKNTENEENQYENSSFSSSEIQEELKEIFEDLLEKEASLATDFFDLGGDSLSGTLLLTKINKKFNTKIKLEDILELQSIAKISEYIQTQVTSQTNVKSITI
ncbi:beta-ketoacyl synthase N-terminal-like domain-containing protein [Ascidiimonas sp. W6]|uniref:type I polyketide synthase n=1 Tax=Ascidiimonas meishanensis TaxID=3128903 RepID=UPI0030EDEBAD